MQIVRFSDLLYKYLILNGSLSIPNIGNFEICHVPAINNLTNKKLFSSEKTIRFKNVDEKKSISLLTYISKKMTTTIDQAQSLLNDFSKKILDEISQKNNIVWNGIGTLSMVSNGSIEFTQKVTGLTFYKEQPYFHLTFNKIQEESNSIANDNTDNTLDEYVSQIENQSTKSRKSAIIYLILIAISFLIFRFSIGGFSIFSPKWDPLKVKSPSPTYQKN